MQQQVSLSPEELDTLRFALFRLSKLEGIFPDYAATSYRLYDFLLGFDTAVIRGQL